MNLSDQKYSVLIKLFDITKPNSNEIITLILKQNNGNFIYKSKNGKKKHEILPTTNYEGMEFELILTNNNMQNCSIEFLTYGMGGEIEIYNIKENDYSKIYSILLKFYNLELKANSQDSIIYI